MTVPRLKGIYRFAPMTLALSSVLVACGPISSGQQGVTCDENSDCGSGLQCFSESLAEEGGCTSIGKVCLTLCSDDSDCDKALGPGYTCSSGPCGASVPTCQVSATSTSDSGIPDATASDATASDATANDGTAIDGTANDGTAIDVGTSETITNDSGSSKDSSASSDGGVEEIGPGSDATE
jgi:hypothetical protein